MTNGLIAAPVTAFHDNGSINLDVVPAYARFLQSNGVAGVFVNGTTGEGLSLTVDERCALAEQWVKTANNGFKVIIHVSHTSSIATQELARHAAHVGAFGVAEMASIFFKPGTVEDMVDHCTLTASAVSELPYYYYHMPSMNGTRFPMLDFLQSAAPKIPNLAGVKYTHEDLFDFEMCRAFRDGKYDMLHGRDETLLCALALGCRGAVGSTYNIMAPLYLRLIEAFDAGDLAEARQLQRISMKVIRLLADTGCFFDAMKAVLTMQGLNMGKVRPPLGHLTAERRSALKDGLTELGFWDMCSV